MNAEEYRTWMEKMGFNLNFEWLIEMSAQARMFSSEEIDQSHLSSSYVGLATPFLEKLSSTDDLVRATFVRTGRKNPSEYRWLQSCIILLTEALKYEEENIVQAARDLHIIPVMVYLAIAILAKDKAIDGGKVTTSNSREVDCLLVLMV